MEDNKDNFVFYRSWWEAINMMPEYRQLEAYKALIEFGCTRKLPDMTDCCESTKMLITLIAPTIQLNHERWMNGKKGGRKKKVSEPLINQPSVEENNQEYYPGQTIDCNNDTNGKTNGYNENKTQDTNGNENTETSETIDSKKSGVYVNVYDNVNVNGICKCNMSLSDRERVQGERETDFLKKLLFDKSSKYPAEELKRFRAYYDSTGGKDKNGNQVLSYLAKLETWEIKEKERILPRAHVSIWKAYCHERWQEDIPDYFLTDFRGFEQVANNGDFRLLCANEQLPNFFKITEERALLLKYIPTLLGTKIVKS